MAFSLVNCSGCNVLLQVPPFSPSIRCALCQSITYVGDTRSASSPYHGSVYPPAPAPHHGPNFGSPNPLRYTPPAPNVHGSKKAVLCGITYKNSRYELKGCINDAKCMKYMLTSRFHFPEESVLLLTEEERDPTRIPTGYNMRMAMFWLIQGCKPGDSLVFHFSGHGSQQYDASGDEVDGKDETLCPLDFETRGMIVDDEINATLVRPLPPGVRLHAIIDSCHSGTVLDLPFLCHLSNGRFQWEDQRGRTYKGTSGGEAYSFSGCGDSQTSADTTSLANTNTGAMTFCFINAIEQGSNTYGSILDGMHYKLKTTGSGSRSGFTSLIDMLVTGGSYSGGFTQVPQLTAHSQFDVNTPFYL